ncbi:MAG: GH26, partial [uncultured Quadrisphaera sp.]
AASGTRSDPGAGRRRQPLRRAVELRRLLPRTERGQGRPARGLRAVAGQPRRRLRRLAGAQELARHHQPRLAVPHLGGHPADEGLRRRDAARGGRLRHDGALRRGRVRRAVVPVRDQPGLPRARRAGGGPARLGVQRQLVRVVGARPRPVRRVLAPGAHRSGVDRAGPALVVGRLPGPRPERARRRGGLARRRVRRHRGHRHLRRVAGRHRRGELAGALLRRVRAQALGRLRRRARQGARRARVGRAPGVRLGGPQRRRQRLLHREDGGLLRRAARQPGLRGLLQPGLRPRGRLAVRPHPQRGREPAVPRDLV